MSTLHKHNGQVFNRQYDSGAWYSMVNWPWVKATGYKFRVLLSCECPECQAKTKE